MAKGRSETDLVRQVSHLALGADLDVNRELHQLTTRLASATLVLDEELGVLAHSPDMEDLLGLAAGQAKPHELMDVALSPADRVRLDVFSQEAMARNEARQWVGANRDGSPLFIRVQPFLETEVETEGHRLFVSFVHLDPGENVLSGQRAADKRLYYRLSQLEIMIGALPTPVLLHERDAEDMIYGNWRSVKMFKLPRSASNTQFVRLEGASSIDVIDGEKRLKLIEWVKDCVGANWHERTHDIVITVVLADGEQREAVCGFAPLYDVSGDVRGCIITLTDITERRALEREAEIRYRQQQAIAELGLYAMGEPRREAVLKHCCRVAAQTLGVEYANVLHRVETEDNGPALVFETGFGWSESSENFRDELDESLHAAHIIATGAPHIVADYREETEVQRSELLTEHDVMSSVSVPIRGPRELYGVLGVHSRQPKQFSEMDIDFVSSISTLLSHALYREHYEQRLAESRERLARAEADRQLAHAERLTSLGTLAAGIAHEINNPLNSIMMNAELIKMQLDAGAESDALKPSLDRIMDDCRRSARITKSVLSFAKRDAERVREPVDPAELVDNVEKVLSSVLQTSRLAIETQILPGIPRILGSSTELEQILINLIKNSAEAGADAVSLELDEQDGQVRIQVVDNGPGINHDHLEHIFDPFFSTKRGEGGTGLGLSLVHRIVDDHDGSISVENLNSVGCRFEIRLPTAENDADSDH